MLLRAVVEVTLDASTLGVGDGDESGTRRPQLHGLITQLGECGRQRRVEPGIVKHQPELSGGFGHDHLIGLGELVGTGWSTNHHQPE